VRFLQGDAECSSLRLVELRQLERGLHVALEARDEVLSGLATRSEALFFGLVRGCAGLEAANEAAVAGDFGRDELVEELGGELSGTTMRAKW
jgi:hypothetical protein